MNNPIKLIQKTFNITTDIIISVVKIILSIYVILSIITISAYANSTKAKQAILLDFNTGHILMEKAADTRMYPASMTKMMTAFMLFDRLKNGSLSLDDSFSVSKKAWRKGGSKMFVEIGKQVKVEDLLRGIIIQSGNDATIVVAEGISGSEENFAIEMTKKARELGMLNTQFKNASGWPDDEHYTTARDLSILATAIIRDHPEYYHIYSEKSFKYSGIDQPNRNPLLYANIGADGLKTGHTEASGYGLTASAINGDRRLILVLNGMESKRDRTTESKRIMTWGVKEWNSYSLFQAGENIVKNKVWLGSDASVDLITRDDVAVTMLRKNRRSLKVTVRYIEPIAAPIKSGQELGHLTIEAPDMKSLIIPLFAANDVAKIGILGRIKASINYLLWGGSH